MDSKKLIGIDIGGTNLRIGVFEDLKLIQETRFQANFSQLCQQNCASEALAKNINAHVRIYSKWY